ncbi:MAG TPA: integrase [Marinobacter adhaerens]|jgi:integrase|uniref:Integrase n=1 Tax=Marinobacter adhaerens TaxID=1033846 RepID=A0A352IVH5_9GAMM|nr:integrase [Marinobacter adhaerens]|tara:strand:- start:2408 stop:3673 length:1266 start_codon:yes stop_codon:yes gene_type:complete
MARETNKLTDKMVKAAKPEGQKRRKLADGGGLTLVVKPESKVWWFRYRFGGKEKVFSLGSYPEVTLKEAREGRDKARKLLAQKKDPVTHRRSEGAKNLSAASNTFKAVAEDWLKLQKGQLQDSTIDVTRNRLTNWIYPHLGTMPITEIEPPLVLQVLRKIETKGKHETAHRMRQRISQIYRFAISEGRASRDPAADLRGLLKAVPAQNRAAITKPDELGGLLRAIEAYSGQPATCAALQLAPMLFLRPGELRKAVWDEIDLKAGIWIVPGDRMKGTLKAKRAGQVPDHKIPLPRQAIEILKPLKQLTGKRPFVFESIKPGRPLSENTINTALRSMGYDSEMMVGHGFRATASTLLHEMGWPPEVIELQLAHRQRNQVAAAYNRSARIEERTAMMQQWADYLDNLKKGGKVVPFKATGQQNQ